MYRGKNKIINSALLVGIFTLYSFDNNPLKESQMKCGRVKAAYKKHWEQLKNNLEAKEINAEDFELYIRSFKQEMVLEAWVKNTHDKAFKLFKQFNICASSGEPGPKRKQGDGQVPEGFYTIPSLHPYSNYHLAMKVSYPNKSDQIKKTAGNPGGDIMIHGKCCTIGCIPLQDEPVEELYLLCLEVMNRRKTVYCHLFPFKMSAANMNAGEDDSDKETVKFWKSIKTGYDYFELNHSLPQITIDKGGNYLVNGK